MAARSGRALEFEVDIVVEPDGKSFHAYCPALKGLHVDGATEAEAVKNATEAAILYLESMIKRKEPIALAIAERKANGKRSARRLTRRLEVKVA